MHVVPSLCRADPVLRHCNWATFFSIFLPFQERLILATRSEFGRLPVSPSAGTIPLLRSACTTLPTPALLLIPSTLGTVISETRSSSCHHSAARSLLIFVFCFVWI